MNLYKKLDISNDLWSNIKQQMLDVIIEDYGDPEALELDKVYGCIDNDIFLERVPDFKVFMKENNIEKLWIACVALTKEVRAHVDFSRGFQTYDSFKTHNLDRRLAINWPVYNSEHSETSYYECADQDAAVIRDNLLINFDESRLKKIDSFVMTTPTIIRADLIHGMKVTNNKTRVIFSTRFDRDPEHLLL